MAKIKVRYGDSWASLEKQYPGITNYNKGTRAPKAGMELDYSDRYDKMNTKTPAPSIGGSTFVGFGSGTKQQPSYGAPQLQTANQTSSPTTTPTKNAPSGNRGGYGVVPSLPTNNTTGTNANTPSLVGNFVDRNRGADTAAMINASNASTMAMMAAANNSALVKQAEVAVQNALAEAAQTASSNRKVRKAAGGEVVMINPKTGKVTHNWKSAHGIKPKASAVQTLETSTDWLPGGTTSGVNWRVG